MNKLRYIAAALALTLVFGARALSLQQAEDFATERYPLMREYNLLALTEQYSLDNASKAWLPQVAVGAQSTWQSAVPSYPDALSEMLSQRGLEIKGMGHIQYKASLDVRQTIWDGGRISAKQKAVRAQAEADRAANDVELYNLRRRVDGIFFGILLMEQQRDALNVASELLKANLNVVNSLVANGAAMQSAADAMEVELLANNQQIIAVEGAIHSYRRVLGLYIGSDGREELEMPQPVSLSDSNDASGRPEMKLFAAKISQIEAGRDEVRASIMPSIGAFAQGYFGYPGMNFMEAMMNRNPGFNAMVGLSVQWNVGDLYTRKNRLSAIEASLGRVAVARDVFAFGTDVRAAQERGEIERLRKISQTDTEIVALRERVRRASEAQLREGALQPTDLLLRITEERNARIAQDTHRIEYIKALYNLQTTLNQ